MLENVRRINQNCTESVSSGGWKDEGEEDQFATGEVHQIFFHSGILMQCKFKTLVDNLALRFIIKRNNI